MLSTLIIGFLISQSELDSRKFFLETQLSQVEDNYRRNAVIHGVTTGVTGSIMAAGVVLAATCDRGNDDGGENWNCFGEGLVAYSGLILGSEILINSISSWISSNNRRTQISQLRAKLSKSNAVSEVRAVELELERMAEDARTWRYVAAGLNLAGAGLIVGGFQAHPASFIFSSPLILYGLADLLFSSQAEDAHDAMKAKFTPWVSPTADGGLSGGLQIRF